MPVFQAKRRVLHGAQNMFDLVADMERYPAFVPLCERHVIRSRCNCGEAEILITEMTVAYALFHETFRTRVTLDRQSGRILGPRHRGTIAPTGDALDVPAATGRQLRRGILPVL